MAGAAEQDHASANILEVPLPAIEYHGVAMPAMTMRFKRVADLLEAPCIELSNENLEHVRLAVLAAGERDTAVHRDRHDTGSSHIRFSRQKGAYIAWRVDEATTKTRWKTFNFSKKRGDQDQKVGREVMMDRAIRWIAEGHDDEDSETELGEEAAAHEWDIAVPLGMVDSPATSNSPMTMSTEPEESLPSSTTPSASAACSESPEALAMQSPPSPMVAAAHAGSAASAAVPGNTVEETGVHGMGRDGEGRRKGRGDRGCVSTVGCTRKLGE